MLELIGNLIGGLGLFLLGMQLMTNGLKRAAGPALRKALSSATQSKLRGLLSGTLITAAVQSSSAVTVAMIGFVNAGLLNLSQSVAVIYGCNIGSTMTSWLVALIGFKIKISAFALPIIGFGMLCQLLGSERRIGHIGLAIAGFGTFFIGLDFLKNSFDGLGQQLPLDSIGEDPFGLLLFALAGLVMTFLMQSSAASMAITLSLTASGLIGLAAAGALVIGANVGTTTTAMLAVIGATPNAKRIAAAHVIFNLITGALGLLLLLVVSQTLTEWMNTTTLDLVILLALFHTLFNVAGVLLLWPFTEKLVSYLMGRFRSQEEDLSQPHFLDQNVITTPSLAIDALRHELARICRIVTQMARAAISAESPDPAAINSQLNSVQKLVGHIGEYNQLLSQQDLTPEISEILPYSMRVSRYYNEIARISSRLPEYYQLLDEAQSSTLSHQILEYKKETLQLLDLCELHLESDSSSFDGWKQIQHLEDRYQQLKASILDAIVGRQLGAEEGVGLLDALSHIHRLAQQSEKGSRYWSTLTPLQHRAKIEQVTQVEKVEPRDETAPLA